METYQYEQLMQKLTAISDQLNLSNQMYFETHPELKQEKTNAANKSAV